MQVTCKVNITGNRLCPHLFSLPLDTSVSIWWLNSATVMCSIWTSEDWPCHLDVPDHHSPEACSCFLTDWAGLRADPQFGICGMGRQHMQAAMKSNARMKYHMAGSDVRVSGWAGRPVGDEGHPSLPLYLWTGRPVGDEGHQSLSIYYEQAGQWGMKATYLSLFMNRQASGGWRTPLSPSLFMNRDACGGWGLPVSPSLFMSRQAGDEGHLSLSISEQAGREWGPPVSPFLFLNRQAGNEGHLSLSISELAGREWEPSIFICISKLACGEMRVYLSISGRDEGLSISVRSGG